MLRFLFILTLVAVGACYTLQSPFYALLFYLGNAYFRPEDWVWWGRDLITGLHLSLLSGIYVVSATLVSGQRLAWNSRVALLWLFLLQSFLSTLSSEHFGYCWGYWGEFLKVIVISYLIVIFATNFTKFRLIILVIVVALGLEQAKQGWFYLLTSLGGSNDNPVAFLGDRNGVAQGMLMLVPCVGLLAQTTQNKWTKKFYYIMFIGCLYRALSTYSRGGFLACIAMGGAWWLRSRQKVRTLLGMFLVLVLVLPALPDAFWNRMHTIQTYEEEQDDSALGRLHFWTVAVDMVNANPLFGVGFNGYNPSYNEYDFSDGRYGRNRSVHSTFFGVLAELGYPGAIIFALVLVSAFRSCSLVRKRAAQDPMLSGSGKSALALETSLVAFVVSGIFLPSQYSEMFWHMIGLTVALNRLAMQRPVETFSRAPEEEPMLTVASKTPAAA
jgi:putative inorganic carbon (HCO3(-)) transporter